MSLKFNKVFLAATLTADPDIRTTGGGKTVASLRLADSDSKKDPQTGEWTRTNQLFIDAKCFDKTAEMAQKFAKKGKRFLFEGRLTMEQWEDKATGQPRSKLVLLVDRITFCEDANGQEGSGANQPRSGGRAPVAKAESAAGVGGDDFQFDTSNLPF